MHCSRPFAALVLVAVASAGCVADCPSSVPTWSGDWTPTTPDDVAMMRASCVTKIAGDLRIGNVDLESLSEFDFVSVVGGDLIVGEASPIDSYGGMDGLRSIGGSLVLASNSVVVPDPAFPLLESVGENLVVRAPPSLDQLPGFDALVSVGGDLAVAPGLPLPGLKNLQRVGGLLRLDWDDSPEALARLESVAGDLELGGQYADFAGLESLVSLGGLRLVDVPHLESLAGLEGIDELERLFVVDAPLLSSVGGLANLTDVGELTLVNTGLETLDGLAENPRVSVSATISDNDDLTSLAPLMAESSLRFIVVTENPKLTHLDAFYGLTHVEGEVRISGSPKLVDLRGLTSLAEVGGDLRLAYLAITDLRGLVQLERTGTLGNQQGHAYGPRLWLAYLPGLADLSGLENLREIDLLDLNSLGRLDRLDALHGLRKLDDFHYRRCPLVTEEDEQTLWDAVEANGG